MKLHKELNVKMKTKTKKLRKLAGASILLVLIFMVIAISQYQFEDELAPLPDQFEYSYNEGWEMISLDHTEISKAEQKDPDKMRELIQKALAASDPKEIDLPYKGKSNAGDVIVFKNTLSTIHAGLTLSFASADTSVRVFFDGKVIYQYGFEEGSAPEDLQKAPGKDQAKDPGEDPKKGQKNRSDKKQKKQQKEDPIGKNENFVDIPNIFQDGEIWIVLTSSDPDMASSLSNIKIETRDMVIIGMVGNNVADIGCCLLIMIMSLIMFVLAAIRLYTHQPGRGELFLGLTGLAAGIYCFIGTDTLNIFYDLQEAYEMQEYLVLLIPLLLTLYFEWNLHTVYPRRFLALLLYVSINSLLQILLQILGIRNMQDMTNLSAAAVGVVCMTALVSLVQYDHSKRRYQALVSVLSMLVLLSGGIANVIMNVVLKTPGNNMAGQYSMALFSIMMAFVHIFQLSIEYRANAEKTAQLLAEKVKVTEQQNTQLILAKKDADAARHEALAANEAKGKFLAHMSHEIRTPINAVLGMVEMILRESREQNIKEYAMDIYMAGQTLLSLINDILDFSKIESGKMEIVPVEYDTSSMIHDLVNMTTQRAKDKDIKFELHIDPQIPSRLYGDDVRIRQILTNILTNAVKYTPEGTVWLRIQSHQTDETALLQFEVEDTGIGIKEEDLPKLSAEFERIEEDRNRNIEGSGLGMSITIQLLTLLGSKLQVESTYGKGSKFYFELEQKIVDHTPIGDFGTRVQQLAESYDHNTKFCAPDASILVVDDNAVNRKVFRNLLKETLIQITDVEKGAECLELVQENHYDLIFLDHMMPEMDGIETLHHIKELSDHPCKDTPIVVLTANAVSGAKEKYLSIGFDDFLSKPIAPAKLENMIQKMLPGDLLQEPAADSPSPALPQQSGLELPQDLSETLPSVDGLDWQYAWIHLPDTELLEYTVKEFYAQIDPAADDLAQAFGQITVPEQLERYRIQVHAMKSLAATIGIMPLSGVAKILEYAARDGKIDVISSITPAFLEEWRSYTQKLQGVFDIGTAEKKQVTDTSVLQALLEMLRISMQEMDIDQADQLMEQLRAYEYPEELGQTMQKLAQAVTDLDPKEADRLADLLIEQM